MAPIIIDAFSAVKSADDSDNFNLSCPTVAAAFDDDDLVY